MGKFFCTYFYQLNSDYVYVQNLLEEIYMPEEILRLLLGGVGWGFGLMFAGQGERGLVGSDNGRQNGGFTKLLVKKEGVINSDLGRRNPW